LRSSNRTKQYNGSKKEGKEEGRKEVCEKDNQAKSFEEASVSKLCANRKSLPARSDFLYVAGFQKDLKYAKLRPLWAF
jgi:hypothetical protein